jgi:hypothetical protein
VLTQIGQTTDPDALRALAAAVQALAPKLSETQAQAALTPVLTQIGHTTDRDALQALAAVVQALAPKLSEARSSEARAAVRAALAWAATENGASAWAAAYAQLLAPEGNAEFVASVAEALKYPTAAGAAAITMLAALHDRIQAIPADEQGLQTALAVIRKAYPSIDLQSPPVCPLPLPAGQAAGLTCPER